MQFSLGKTLATLTLMVISRAVVAADSASTQQKQNVDDLARAVQNPIANLISLPFQNNTSFEFGTEEKTQNVLNIQPVVPVSLNEEWNLITRTILPVVSQPELLPGQDRENGLGNTLITGFFSPSAPAK